MIIFSFIYSISDKLLKYIEKLSDDSQLCRFAPISSRSKLKTSRGAAARGGFFFLPRPHWGEGRGTGV